MKKSPPGKAIGESAILPEVLRDEAGDDNISYRPLYGASGSIRAISTVRISSTSCRSLLMIESSMRDQTVAPYKRLFSTVLYFYERSPNSLTRLLASEVLRRRRDVYRTGHEAVDSMHLCTKSDSRITRPPLDEGAGVNL